VSFALLVPADDSRSIVLRELGEDRTVSAQVRGGVAMSVSAAVSET
jgi:hypothetical protein